MPRSSLPEHAQLARQLGAAGKQHRIGAAPHFLKGKIVGSAAANLHSGNKTNPLGAQLLDPPLDDVLLHLEMWNAIDQQAAQTIGLFIDRHRVPGAAKLLRRGQSRRPGADNRDPLPRLKRGRLGNDPALRKATVGNRLFNLLNRHRRLVNAQHARRLAGRGADAAGELGKIVGRVQPAYRLFPAVLVDQLVPVRE